MKKTFAAYMDMSGIPQKTMAIRMSTYTVVVGSQKREGAAAEFTPLGNHADATGWLQRLLGRRNPPAARAAAPPAHLHALLLVLDEQSGGAQSVWGQSPLFKIPAPPPTM